ncbi:MAG: glycosyltransferase [Thermoplasmatota archaeon]
MKIAVLHTTFTQGNNGAERLCYLLAREFGSKIYTADYHPRVDSSYPGIKDMLVVKKIKHPDSFSRKDFEIMDVMERRDDIDADVILYSGNQTCFRIRSDPTPYVYFCHTPERGFFDLYDDLKERMKKWGFPRYQISRYFFEKRRKMDIDLFRNHVNPEQVVTNSKLVMDRYERCYGKRPRRAVGAPIDTSIYKWKEPGDFFFTASGLRWNKRIDWQIGAAAKAKVKLKIAGDGPMMGELRELSKKLRADVEFLGRIGERELIEQYSSCKAFIFSAKDEDFGMVPLEALASGKPVFCVGEGGPMEYLNNSNSFLFRDEDGLAAALGSCDDDAIKRMKADCMKSAEYFDVKKVARRIKDDLVEILAEFYRK